MAEAEAPQEAAPKKKSKLPVILGLVLFLALGGGGFFAVYTGLILAQASDGAAHGAPADHAEDLPPIAFVALDPITISLGDVDQGRHLRLGAQLEVNAGAEADVLMLKPRILDVLNGYLRAVELAELTDPHALVRMRAQMLRRIQIVTGEGRVRDLLVTEFVIN